jgi:hypothetical protein
MKYRVHVYAVVRVPVEVDAESQLDAIKLAENARDWDQELNAGDHEFADEIVGFLVDEDGDPEYLNSKMYDEPVTKVERN